MYNPNSIKKIGTIGHAWRSCRTNYIFRCKLSINKPYLHHIADHVFDTLIDSFVRDHVGIAEDFLSVPLAAHLRDNLNILLGSHLLRPAGIGRDAIQAHDSTVRGDQIYWLDRRHGNIYENEFLDMIDQFVIHLNSSCYAGITGYEFHYAHYAEGSFYHRHLDRFRSSDARQYSLIMYLNEDWQKADGGELCIHHRDHDQTISPLSGRGVFFRSQDLEHEVFLTHRSRMSITGWLTIK